MPLLHWDEKYSTGIREMDEQHKKWMELINRFYDRINDVKLQDNMKDTLKEAIDYTVYHFDQEEKFMADKGYSKLSEQKKEHERIKNKLFEFQDLLDHDKLVVSSPLTREMKSWFNEHITNMDKEYGDLS